MMPTKAFILAAGFGTRMRPLTDTLPKPLLRIGGQSLLDRTLDQLAACGVREVVVNTHYLGAKIEAALAGRHSPHIHLSHEPVILDTGGGIKNALRHFEADAPFFVLSGDGYAIDGPEPELRRLAAAWNGDRMDILLSLQPLSSMTVTPGIGDYDLSADGRAQRSKSRAGTYMFNSIRIHHPRIFNNTPDGPFSYLDLMDRAEAQGRLYGLAHAGVWHHLSTPEDIAAVEASLNAAKKAAP